MTLDDVQNATPLQNSLPGDCLPYYLAAGEGLRYELGGQLVTVIARPEDTGGQFSAAYVYGAPGTETPFVSHADAHRFLYVTDGQLQVWLPEQRHLLVAGDSVTIPAGTPYAYRMTAHRTRFLSWLTGPAGHGWLHDRGRETLSHVYDAGTSPMQQSETAERFGVQVHDLEKMPTGLPTGQTPYVLRAGAGDRWAGQDQLNTFLARPANTDGTYFAMHTIGSKSPYIPRHFHREHTENFFCLEGRILLHVNGQELLLTKGDFVHAPAGTVHSFAFDSHITQMLGLLTTGVFEKFFEYMNTPTEAYVHTEGADVGFPVQGFALARAELDLEVVGPPPVRGG